MSQFYQTWIKLVIWGIWAFGAILALHAFPATELPSKLFYELIQRPVPEEPGNHFRFAMGLMGCISMGWGLTMFVFLKATLLLEPAQAREVWRGFLFAVLFWYITDNIASIYTGYPLNAISNTVLILLFIIPLWKSGVLRNPQA
jgi:hypothetical protein